ncbi:MAG: hypothetical protein AMJ90_05575 [candidate division Zixibacteria bacterium SM23_73_2]|nr:MAG: hypothetical protein AMJ90_05575 [candidate division Zixibacteria bacterium SM23_73_2]
MPKNIKLEIEYDGTSFSGWQTQPRKRTVQKEIENKLEKILGSKTKIIGAGRTDAGVHALGQVASFKTKSRLKEDQIKNALNGVLPEDIVIKNIEEVDSDFNARYSAKSKIYQYRIYLTKTALNRNYAWEIRYNLNMKKLKEATEKIIGKKDFSSFCVVKSTKKNNICKVKKAFWRKKKSELVFEIEGDRFLHSMVRALVGTLVDVGRGYFKLFDFERIIDSKDRKKAGITAPAKGLYLLKVNY